MTATLHVAVVRVECCTVVVWVAAFVVVSCCCARAGAINASAARHVRVEAIRCIKPPRENFHLGATAWCVRRAAHRGRVVSSCRMKGSGELRLFQVRCAHRVRTPNTEPKGESLQLSGDACAVRLAKAGYLSDSTFDMSDRTPGCIASRQANASSSK